MKKILLGFGLVATVFFFTGCEKRDPNQGKLLEPGQTLKLQIWTVDHKDIIDALGREFMAAAKTPGLTVQVVEFTSQEDLSDTLVNSMAEGEGPDVVVTNGVWIANNTKKLVPREGDISFTPDMFRATFVRSANETLIQDEKIYGVPLGVDSLAVIYNEEHILDHLPASNLPAKTWDGWKEDVANLTKTNNSFERFLISGAALGRVDNLHYGVEILENILHQLGVITFTEDGTESRLATTVVPVEDKGNVNAGVEGVELYTSFADEKYKHYSWNEFISTGNNDQKEWMAFIQGKVSMIFGYAGDYRRIMDFLESQKNIQRNAISPRNVRVAFFPQISDPKVNREILGEVVSLAVPKVASDTDIAWRFLKFVTRKENLQAFHDATDIPTPRVDQLKEQELKPHVGIYVRQAKFARAAMMPFSRPKYQDLLADMVQDINDERITITDALNTIQNTLTAHVRARIQRNKIINPES